MKTEQSAGGVVIRKIQNVWHVLLMRDMNNTWTFPKGIIEDTENPRDAAGREIFEEVGLGNLTLVKSLGSVEYFYRRNGRVQKTVQYYLFVSKGKKQPVCQKEEGIRDASFFLLEKAIEIVGYEKTNKSLLIKASKIFQTI
jgi:ADP-ribose pyrophosphatase YjhB (NUDIX family)